MATAPLSPTPYRHQRGFAPCLLLAFHLGQTQEPGDVGWRKAVIMRVSPPPPPASPPGAELFSDKCVGPCCLERESCHYVPIHQMNSNYEQMQPQRGNAPQTEALQCDSQKLHPGSVINFMFVFSFVLHKKPVTASKIPLWCECIRRQLQSGGDLRDE